MKTTIKTCVAIYLAVLGVSLACFTSFAPKAFGVTPPPDGGYPGKNTAEGQDALFSLTNGTSNTANGFSALKANTNGDRNTANGTYALFTNVTGSENTATGYAALFFNRGSGNTANGIGALHSNATGTHNTANGQRALYDNLSGSKNTANGSGALGNNTMGDNNTADGFQALGANTTGSFNIALGNNAGSGLSTADDVICIGAAGADASHSCYIGNIFNQPSPSGLAVLVNSDGKLGTIMSSSRFKEDIKPMDKASEAILALQPVTFRYKKDFDSIGTAQFGLVAEDVAKVNPDLVVRDKEGKPYSVRYDQVNAMLLNEFLKERKKVEDQQETVAQLKSDATKQETAAIELKSTVAQQQKAMEVLTAQLQEQAAQIQRMSAQLATVRPSRGGLELNKFAKGR
ncbi:MAG TPA: tail fiber domain-containing protein [Candidatus Udaeobacter sp.]